MTELEYQRLVEQRKELDRQIAAYKQEALYHGRVCLKKEAYPTGKVEWKIMVSVSPNEGWSDGNKARWRSIVVQSTKKDAIIEYLKLFPDLIEFHNEIQKEDNK